MRVKTTHKAYYISLFLHLSNIKIEAVSLIYAIAIEIQYLFPDLFGLVGEYDPGPSNCCKGDDSKSLHLVLHSQCAVKEVIKGNK